MRVVEVVGDVAEEGEVVLLDALRAGGEVVVVVSATSAKSS